VSAAGADIARDFRWQAEWCGRLGSPLYRMLLEHAAGEIERGGPAAMVLDDPATGTTERDGALPGARALRLMGAVHRLVLEGGAPELARFYPSAGGTVGEGVREAFSDVLARRREEIAREMRRPVQTNEPGRSAGLLGGFLQLADETGLPLRLLEVGASAGLNLRWDRYRYTAPNGAWGDPGSPLRFDPAFTAGNPPLHVRPEIAERRGCDPGPLDPRAREDRLTLQSYVWPDQSERFAQLRGALDVAAQVPATVDRAGAAEWLEGVLAEPRPGVASVVFHSVVLPYLGEAGVIALARAIEGAGARATPAAPLAWLSLEAGAEQADVRLTTWPGGESRVLAHATFHGPPVRWLAG
jgi:hypothetical protein